jgi:hypothetical protein
LSLGYKIYGLRIATNRPLPGLIIQPIADGIDVQIWLKDSKSEFPSGSSTPASDFLYVSPNCDEHGQPNLRVVMLDGGKYFGFFYSDGARFAVDREAREVWADWPENSTLEDACMYLVGPVIAFVLRLRGVTCLHASAIALDDRAIALFGLAGAGKSTTAAAFALGGHPVLSDDVAVLADLGDRFLVQPGYPRLNLWPDSVRTLFGSEDALPRITPTWDKRYLALDQNGRRFQSSPLPLSAIYILGEREAELSAPVIEEVVGRKAIMTLVANTYVNYLLDADMRSREFDVLARLATRVHVRRVRAAADPSRLFALCKAIVSDASQIPVRESKNIA